jgi:hypothetical protein
MLRGEIDGVPFPISFWEIGPRLVVMLVANLGWVGGWAEQKGVWVASSVGNCLDEGTPSAESGCPDDT